MPDQSLCTDEKLTMVQSPRSRKRLRSLLCLVLFLGFSWSAYTLFTQSKTIMATEQVVGSSTLDQPETIFQKLGLSPKPKSKGIIQLLDLPPDYLPETGHHRHSGRLVVVGDVHGMKASLQDLLRKIKFDQKHDHLILAGDMISKGPDSPGVVDLAMALGATGVRGNHEDRILLAYRNMNIKHVKAGGPGLDENENENENEDERTIQDSTDEESFSQKKKKDKALVKALGEHRIKWLKRCPVILRVGQLGDMEEVVVVHAGLVPGVLLEKQDPSLVMNMRTIDKGGVPSDRYEGTVWTKAWNELQKSLPKKKRTTVIYGHDSKRGLQIEDYSLGIDTGCLKGGKLTAVVIEGGESHYTHRLVHVNCKDGRN